MSSVGFLRFVATNAFTIGMSGWALLRQVGRSDRARFQADTRAWARGLAIGNRIDVRAFGADRLDPGGTYVLMANHQSHADIIALFNGLPMTPGFLAKAELRKVPFFGRAMEVGGHVFVERGERGRARVAIAKAAADVRSGGSIVIFPEGTRSRRREVMPFKKGGFHLAKAAQVPIVPVGLRNTAAIIPKHSQSFEPGSCEVHIGEPISVDRVAALGIDELVLEVHRRVCELADLPAAPDRSGA